jgi:hypothetical protein
MSWAFKKTFGTAWRAFDKFYALYAKPLVLFCVLAATCGVIIGTTAQVQSARAVEANRVLTQCLVDWSAESSATSKAVREVSAQRDLAEIDFFERLNEEGDAFYTLVDRLTDPATSPEVYDVLIKQLRDTLDKRGQKTTNLIKAINALKDARTEYPVPPPPAEFCGLQSVED